MKKHDTLVAVTNTKDRDAILILFEDSGGSSDAMVLSKDDAEFLRRQLDQLLNKD